MSGKFRGFDPFENYLARTMQEQELFEVPALEYERRHEVLFFLVLFTGMIVIAEINIFIRKNEGASIAFGLEGAAILADVGEISAACIFRHQHHVAALLVQVAVEFLNVSVFGIAFANYQYRFFRFHGDQI